jgi:hypothetical protein
LGGDPIEHVHVPAALDTDEGGQQADRACPDDQDDVRVPEGPLADDEDLLPCLGDDRGGFQEDGQDAKALVHPDRVVRLDAPALGHKSVDLLDAALGVAPVGAHVPLAHCAIGAGRRIGSAHNTHDMLADREPAWPRVDDSAEGFVAQDQAIPTRRRPPVISACNLRVGATDADGKGLHDHRPELRKWLWYLLQLERACGAWAYRYCLHVDTLAVDEDVRITRLGRPDRPLVAGRLQMPVAGP